MVYGRRGFRRFRRGFKRFGRRRGSRGIFKRARSIVRKFKKRAQRRKFRAFTRKMCPPKLVRLRTVGVPQVLVTDCEFRGCLLATAINQAGPIVCTMGASVRANSIYDPNTAVSGTFNQSATKYHNLMEKYEKYEVLSSKGVFTLRQYQIDNLSEEDAHNTIKWGVSLDNNNTVSFLGMNWPTACQRPTTKSRTFMQSNQIGIKGVNVQTIKMYWTKAGIHRDPATTSASATADPSDTEFWHPWWAMCQDGAGYVDNANCNIEIYVRYTVRFTNPKDIEGMSKPFHQS